MSHNLYFQSVSIVHALSYTHSWECAQFCETVFFFSIHSYVFVCLTVDKNSRYKTAIYQICCVSSLTLGCSKCSSIEGVCIFTSENSDPTAL